MLFTTYYFLLFILDETEVIITLKVSNLKAIDIELLISNTNSIYVKIIILNSIPILLYLINTAYFFALLLYYIPAMLVNA